MSQETERLDVAAAEELEKQYDSALALRTHTPFLAKALFVFTIIFALYHYLTAGFGLPVDYWHMGLHLSGLFLLVFTGFPFLRRDKALVMHPDSVWRIGNVPYLDWVFAVLGIMSALYLGFSWRGFDFEIFGWAVQLKEQALRQGDPALPDIIFGTILVVLVLEIARRALGFVLPMIILVFVAYALLGPHLPFQILRHPGVDWRQFINNMYFPAGGHLRCHSVGCLDHRFPFRPLRRDRAEDGVGAVLHR